MESSMPGLTFLRVVGNAEIDESERLREEAVRESQQRPVITGLQAYIRQCWDAARMAKRPIEEEMLRSLRQRNGEYDATKLAQIRAQGGSEIFMMITEVKCRAAESWLRDILMDDGAPPWSISPTPIPDLPPETREAITEMLAEKVTEMIQLQNQAPNREEMMEMREMITQDFRFKKLREAQNRADKMQMKIEDQFAEGGWGEAFNEFITDLVTFSAAFIKGPIVRRRKSLSWVTDPESGETIAAADDKLAPEFERVDPFYIYPEPGITHPQDGYLFEYHSLTRTDLSELIDVPGYDSDAIRTVLSQGAGDSWISRDLYTQKEDLENKFHTEMRPTDTYDALEFWGKVSGRMLVDWGLEEDQVEDLDREYDANVWVVGGYVIKAVLNFDPLGEKPYCKCSYIKTPGSFWGKGIPEIIRDVQSVCNASARALVNNMGIASGPQVEVNVDRLPANEEITQMFPWKIWQTLNDPMGSSAPAVRFGQPESRADELMRVYEKFSRLADDHSGIPAYIYGDTDVQGAGRTSSGLSMLMGAAGKGIRQVVGYIDHDVIKPIVHRQFVYNMRFDDDQSIKGDVQIIARGAVNLAVKETVNVRRLEFLNATANPIDMEIVGMDGRAAILREVAKGLQMPTDEIVPSPEKARYINKLRAEREQLEGAEGEEPLEREADGSPSGGMDGNVVSSRI